MPWADLLRLITVASLGIIIVVVVIQLLVLAMEFILWLMDN